MILRPPWFWLVLFIPFYFLTAPQLTLAQSESDKAAQEARLRADLAVVEQQIQTQTTLLKSKQKETASVQRDIDILTVKINTAKLKIKAKQIEISRLGGVIVKKEKTIGLLGDKINDNKVSLAELLRNYRELDDVSTVEVALGSQNISDFFADLNSFQFIQEGILQAFTEIRGTQKKTEKEKVVLVGQRDEEINAKKAIEIETANIQKLEKEKKVLLSLNKTQESAYKLVLAAKQKERAAILNALFKLRDAKGISFGQALDYANKIAQKTGIRPAFLLAIITQESDTQDGNLGMNVGTCNRPQDARKYTEVMKPERDIEPFLQITKELGLDPNSMPVSCPYGGGYGGAMGPAQFIPSTWVMYKSRITSVTGSNPPNPWNPYDAFAASALLLKDNGAVSGNYSSEKKAALKYYAGGNWAAAKNAFYGNQVMAKADRYQAQIDTLQNN